jgi:hypothetical protein
MWTDRSHPGSLRARLRLVDADCGRYAARMLASAEDMKELKSALLAGRRVELHINVGSASSSLRVAQESAQRAAEANARGEAVALTFDADGEPDYECGLDANEAEELRQLGAIDA